MSTTYGKNLKITIYGGSHDSEIGVIAEGLPRGFKVDIEKLRAFMERRAPGRNAYSTKRKEPDIPVFLSGMSDDTLTGETLKAVIYNTNQRSSDYSNTAFVPRPSHADFAARMKYGDKVDLRGGGHFSGRLTAPMCIVGGICLQYLESRGIYVGAHALCVGNEYDRYFDPVSVTREELECSARSDFPVLDPLSGEKMRAVIEEARLSCDSVGGIIECAAIGLPAGLGEHIFCGVENRISGIVFGIPAVKGIEFGRGFEAAHIKGSENNDGFYTDGERIFTKTNNAGGILGGMTTAMPLIFRAAMKPTPSIFKEQDSVDMVTMTNTKLSIKGRHDPCVVIRAVPVFEAATAIAICDMLFDESEAEK
ncbi:MAG: chorismate synthase [Ruminococcaceae bacterium]|nr:chorismate synthase [Oscillospiraceae bacterium]